MIMCLMVVFMFIQRPFPATPKGSMWLKGLVNFAKKLGFGCSEQRLQLGSSAQACSSSALSPSKTTNLDGEGGCWWMVDWAHSQPQHV